MNFSTSNPFTPLCDASMRRMASPPNVSSLIAYAVGHDGAHTSADGRTGSAVHFHQYHDRSDP
jgi:hypothetical protein